MDIEITIKVGDRSVSDDGVATWGNIIYAKRALVSKHDHPVAYYVTLPLAEEVKHSTLDLLEYINTDIESVNNSGEAS